MRDLDYPRKKFSMEALEKELLTFSNDIRLQDDITIIEARFAGGGRSACVKLYEIQCQFHE